MATTGDGATASRMNAELSRLLRALRRESEAPQMMAIGLDAIMGSLGAEGIAVIRCAALAGSEPEVLHRAGMIGAAATAAVRLLQRAGVGVPEASVEPNARPIAVGVCRQTGVEKLGVVLWRRRGAREWASNDMPLIDAVAGIVRLLLDRAAAADDVVRSEPSGSLAPLLNQRSFIAEATRHIARLERDELPGTLLLAEVDNMANTMRSLGQDGREQVLRCAETLLRGAVRPTDLVGRTGETEFAVWLSGADYLTVAERAETLCLEAPSRGSGSDNVTASEVSFSIGIATRLPGESFSDVAGRAGQAMRQVKAEGGGYWRVALARAA